MPSPEAAQGVRMPQATIMNGTFPRLCCELCQDTIRRLVWVRT